MKTITLQIIQSSDKISKIDRQIDEINKKIDELNKQKEVLKTNRDEELKKYMEFDSSKSSVHQFFESEYHLIIDIDGPELHKMYLEFCNNENITPLGKKNFDLNVKIWCGQSKNKRIKNQVKKVYNIIPEKLEELENKYIDNIEDNDHDK